MPLDLNLLPLARCGGLDQPELPGLYAVLAPRRTARGRQADRLILHLSISGNAPLSVQQSRQILSWLADTYYRTPGTVTAGLRAVAEALNEYLLSRNRQSTGNGRQGVGLLTAAVLRDEALTLGQSGPTHAFLVTPRGVQHLHDVDLTGRGLGLGRTAAMRFSQFQLKPGDLLIFSPQPPPFWSETTLQTNSSQGLESLRRRLVSQAGDSLDAVVIQAQAGKGNLRLLRPKAGVQAETPIGREQSPAVTAQAVTTPSLEAQAAPQEATTPSLNVPEVRAVEPTPPTTREAASGAKPLTPAPPPGRWLRRPSPPLDESRRPAPASPPETATPSAGLRLTLPKVNLAPVQSALTSLGHALGKSLRALAAGLNTLARRVLPDESLLQIPASTMIFVAVAIPVLLGVAGGYVYLQRGRAEQHRLRYQQAAVAAVGARQVSIPAEQHHAWQNVLLLLDAAEFYGRSPESQALRDEAIAAIDSMEWVRRLDFQPAIAGALDASIQVTRMAATADELYLLNGAQGHVRRAFFTGRAYEMDDHFLCSLPAGEGPIIDIVALPKGNSQNAEVMGMDASGNLIFCRANNESPLRQHLAPPITNWIEPTAFTLENSTLYLLDPPTNGVWVYPAMSIDQQPYSFFSDNFPENIQTAIDLAVSGDDLYLLHDDGTLSRCTFSGYEPAPTRCQAPAPYQDSRQIYTPGPRMPDTQFTQILYTPPPEASLYLLDANRQAIYHFSMQLTFQRQYRALQPLANGGAPTAFAVSPNRRLFIAIGNQVFYATNP